MKAKTAAAIVALVVGVSLVAGVAVAVNGRPGTEEAVGPVPASAPEETRPSKKGPFEEIVSTSLSIKAPKKVRKGAKAKITGTLSATEPACVNASTVSLKRGSKTVKSATTSATGAYKFGLKIKRKTTVQVTFGGRLVDPDNDSHPTQCLASSSAKKTIKVRV